METISRQGQLDILLVLALVFEKRLGTANELSAKQIAEKSFAMLNREEKTAIWSRADFHDRLTDEKQKLWQEVWLDRIRRRGRPIRLDENINPTQIAAALSNEIRSIQSIILRNLPVELSRQVGPFLDPGLKINVDAHHDWNVNEEITAVIKQQFLSNFVSLENIYDPTALDKLSAVHLRNFIVDLGTRELAVACRGIPSKEALASLLGRFREEDARKIGEFIIDLESVEPFWVSQADILVRNTWQADLEPEKLLVEIGFRLLAIAFIGRSETAKKYTAQKLSSIDGDRWLFNVKEIEAEYFSAADEAKTIFDNRRKVIERLANTFSRTGRL